MLTAIDLFPNTQRKENRARTLLDERVVSSECLSSSRSGQKLLSAGKEPLESYRSLTREKERERREGEERRERERVSLTYQSIVLREFYRSRAFAPLLECVYSI